MSLIRLLTATEKQVHLGRLHMRPIQWHFKNNWRFPESLEKIIPLPRTLHPHLQWWLKEDNVLQGQPLHPVKHALQIFTDASKEGWGAHLNEFTARGSWSVPESKLHINYLELKAVFLALKEFQDLCVDKIVLVATDNTTVVAYINLQNLDLVFPATSNSKSQTHPRPFKCDSRQTIQAGSDHPNRVVPPSGGFSTDLQPMAPASNRSICHEVQPQVTSVCLSSTRLPGCSSGCTYSAMGRSGCIRLPTDRHIGQSGGAATGKRLILIAPGWPNMPWFWDLVTMSSQVPLSLPNLPKLLTQPFNQIPHRNLTNLNLHAWLLEPRKSKNRASLRQWQQELRLLKGDRLDQSMRQSGPFLQNGASLIRWTSGHHL